MLENAGECWGMLARESWGMLGNAGECWGMMGNAEMITNGIKIDGENTLLIQGWRQGGLRERREHFRFLGGKPLCGILSRLGSSGYASKRSYCLAVLIEFVFLGAFFCEVWALRAWTPP